MTASNGSRPAGQQKVLYGGDYNPEQWPREIWDDDHAAFDLAGIDTLTLGVFDWALISRGPDHYDFTLLDAVVDRVAESGRQFVMGTATGALPPWLAHQHPEVNRTDFDGRRHVYGQRHNACPSSPVFRTLSARLAGKIAERYAGHPQLVAWHIGNEYGGACYCENCAAAFRIWLRDRYRSMDRLNEAWNAAFWSHTFTDWAEIVPPNALSEHWRGQNHTAFQGITIDYLRFMSDAMLQNFVDEKAAIRRHDASTPATTNFMGMYRPIDYHRWAAHLDFASWDNYPPTDRSEARMAFTHDLMRGLKGGDPFWVMEQTPTITASRDINPVKRPGVLRLWSWQSVAHGADAVLYFQMRQSRGACEKYHGAVLDHSGRTDTRAFREVSELGADFARVGASVLGARTPARTALLFDWDSWWASEITDGLNRTVSYPSVVLGYHRALWEAGVQLDVVGVDAPLDGYDVVIAPLLHMIKGDTAEQLRAVAERGGSVVSTFHSGRVDQDTNAFLADMPGPLAPLFGVRVEETDSLPADVVNRISLTGTGPERTVTSHSVFEILVAEGAEVFGTYGDDFYAGRPAVTRRRFPAGGSAWYVGTLLDPDGIAAILSTVLAENDLIGPYAGEPELEFAVRSHGDSRTAFMLNHADTPVTVAAHAAGTDLLTGRVLAAGEHITLGPKGVVVLQETSSVPGRSGTDSASHSTPRRSSSRCSGDS